MQVIFDHERVLLLHGDCRDLALPDNSVDAIVCDPPYLLANASGTGFMGREWDSVLLGDGETVGIASERWHRTWTTSALRVLKPGGHMLAFGGSRTFHRMCSAIEDVGFELRDVLMWFYGQGMPKSLDVSKAIDAKLGRAREVVAEATNRQGDGTGYGLGHSGRLTSADPNTAAAAAAWLGWGTALKPAYEPIVLARKPLETATGEASTVAGNVLEWGTGGINIDGCRIGDEKRFNPPAHNSPGDVYALGIGGGRGDGTVAVGRWPANILFDQDSAAMLDQHTDLTGSHGGNVREDHSAMGFKGGAKGSSRRVEQSLGGPSRFFYVAKPSRTEKDAGLEHLPIRSGAEITGREEGSAGINHPRAGSLRTGGARNGHVTVKSVELMRYLCRLVTPPGGTVLDVFAGSGTTGVAALAEGFSFVGVELGGDNGEHLPILLGRIRHALGLVDAVAPTAELSKSPEPSTLHLR